MALIALLCAILNAALVPLCAGMTHNAASTASQDQDDPKAWALEIGASICSSGTPESGDQPGPGGPGHTASCCIACPAHQAPPQLPVGAVAAVPTETTPVERIAFEATVLGAHAHPAFEARGPPPAV